MQVQSPKRPSDHQICKCDHQKCKLYHESVRAAKVMTIFPRGGIKKAKKVRGELQKK